MKEQELNEWTKVCNEIEELNYMISQAKIDKEKVPAGPKCVIGIIAFFISGNLFLNVLTSLYVGTQVLGIIGVTFISVKAYCIWYKKSPLYLKKVERLRELKARLTECENMKAAYERGPEAQEIQEMKKEIRREQELLNKEKARREEEEREAYIEAEYDDACRRYYSY